MNLFLFGKLVLFNILIVLFANSLSYTQNITITNSASEVDINQNFTFDITLNKGYNNIADLKLSLITDTQIFDAGFLLSYDNSIFGVQGSDFDVKIVGNDINITPKAGKQISFNTTGKIFSGMIKVKNSENIKGKTGAVSITNIILTNGLTGDDITLTGDSKNIVIKGGSSSSCTNFVTRIDQIVHESVSGKNDGSVRISANGGKEPYLYTLVGKSLANNSGYFSSLSPGDYTVKIEDSSTPTKCTDTKIFTISKGGSGSSCTNFVTRIDQTVNESASGKNDGSARISASGGKEPYLYTLVGKSMANNNGNFSSLSPGDYTVKIEDSSTPTKCTDTKIFTISKGGTSSKNIVCFNLNKNKISSVGEEVEISFYLTASEEIKDIVATIDFKNEYFSFVDKSTSTGSFFGIDGEEFSAPIINGNQIEYGIQSKTKTAKGGNGVVFSYKFKVDKLPTKSEKVMFNIIDAKGTTKIGDPVTYSSCNPTPDILLEVSQTACNAPTFLTVTDIANTSATLSWVAASGSNVLGYIVTVNPGNITFNPSSTNQSITGLTQNTKYTVSVETQCSSGKSVSISSSFSTKADCSALSGISIVANGAKKEALISWNNAIGDNVLGYKIKLNPGNFETIILNNNTYNFTNLTREIDYTVCISTYCKNGEASPSICKSFKLDQSASCVPPTTLILTNLTEGKGLTRPEDPIGLKCKFIRSNHPNVKKYEVWYSRVNKIPKIVFPVEDVKDYVELTGLTLNEVYEVCLKTFCVSDTFSTCAVETVTSRETLNNTNFSIYPNPTKDNIEIKFTETPKNEINVSIYDISGKIVLTQKFDPAKTSSSSIKVNTANLSSGMYSVRILNGNTYGWSKVIKVD